MAKKCILELELRNKIFRLVSKNPGGHIRELERRGKIPYSTLKYHLHYLAKKGLIIEKVGKGYFQYYPKDIEYGDIRILSLLRQKNIRRILLLILDKKVCSPKDLEEFMKLSASTINWYMDGLIKKGIIEKTGGKSVSYRLSYDRDEIIRVIITYRESFLDSWVDKTVDMWNL